jgi:tetratricopeptide (TPR) repeat protein
MRVCLWLCLLGTAMAACSSSSRDETPHQDLVVNEQRRRASLHMQSGNFEAAAITLDSLTRARPNDSDLFELLGDARRGARQVDAAIKAYEQSIRLNYGAYEPHLKLGTLLMENGKTGRALTEFELAVKSADRDVLSRYNYGVALYETGRADEALAQWTVAAGIDPANVRVAEALAMAYSGVNDSTALHYFQRADSLGADSAVFHNNYALLLDRTGRAAEADARFQAAIAKATAPRRDEYRRNHALHFLRTGRNAEAAELFADLVTHGGGRWSDTVYLARANLARERYDEAIAALESFALDVESGKIPGSSPRIDRMPPTLDEALDVLGMCRRGMGHKKEAVEYLRRAVALEPDDVPHLNNYGVVLAEGGMLPEARKQWQRVLEIDPHNATAKANLSAFGR